MTKWAKKGFILEVFHWKNFSGERAGFYLDKAEHACMDLATKDEIWLGIY
jgi:hypothetical protein